MKEGQAVVIVFLVLRVDDTEHDEGLELRLVHEGWSESVCRRVLFNCNCRAARLCRTLLRCVPQPFKTRQWRLGSSLLQMSGQIMFRMGCGTTVGNSYCYTGHALSFLQPNRTKTPSNALQPSTTIRAPQARLFKKQKHKQQQKDVPYAPLPDQRGAFSSIQDSNNYYLYYDTRATTPNSGRAIYTIVLVINKRFPSRQQRHPHLCHTSKAQS